MMILLKSSKDINGFFVSKLQLLFSFQMYFIRAIIKFIIITEATQSSSKLTMKHLVLQRITHSPKKKKKKKCKLY